MNWYTVICQSFRHGGDLFDVALEAKTVTDAAEAGCKMMDEEWGGDEAFCIAFIEGTPKVTTFHI